MDISQNYSIVLVIPDFYDRIYVRELVNMLLVSMGFKQICVQQVRVGSQTRLTVLLMTLAGVPRSYVRCGDQQCLYRGYRCYLDQRGLRR